MPKLSGKWNEMKYSLILEIKLYPKKLPLNVSSNISLKQYLKPYAKYELNF
jgi:hypothetical protein